MTLDCKQYDPTRSVTAHRDKRHYQAVDFTLRHVLRHLPATLAAERVALMWGYSFRPAARVVRLRPGRMNVVRWTPRAGHTAAQNLPARLDLRHIRVLVSVGPSRATLGPARATVFSFKGRFWRLAAKAAKR